MEYGTMVEGLFLDRPNRFTAEVEIGGARTVCHVKNTGRCRELLIPGCRVWLQREDKPGRKTPYSLITVEKNGNPVNLDSQAPNRAAFEWVRDRLEPELLQREKVYGKSRFDLYFERDGKRCFMEVKGVTLEENGAALFPDAPTERGLKHVRELIACRQEGYEAILLFVIQMKGVRVFRPNNRTQPEFGLALKEAERAGVKLLAFDCLVTENTMTIDKRVPVDLGEEKAAHKSNDKNDSERRGK